MLLPVFPSTLRMEADKRLLGELEAMGFSEALSAEALCSSGNSSIEDAVNWLVDHNNDTAVMRCLLMHQQQPQGLVDISINEASYPSLISEQIKLKAQTLRSRANGVQDKKLETEKTKKNLQPVNPGLMPVNSAKLRDDMSECLRSIKRQNKEASSGAIRTFQTLSTYVKNIISKPDEDKFRKIRISNPLFQDRVGKFEEGIKFLELCGFERVEGGNFLLLPERKVDIKLLELAASEIHNALTSPFFGLLSV